MGRKYKNDIERVEEWKRVVLLIRSGELPINAPLVNICNGIDNEAMNMIRNMVKEYGWNGRKGLQKRNNRKFPNPQLRG